MFGIHCFCRAPSGSGSSFQFAEVPKEPSSALLASRMGRIKPVACVDADLMVRMEMHHHSLGARGARPTSPDKESHVEHRGKRCCEGSPRSSDGTKGCSPESGFSDGSFMD